jgi:hypothetical protein
VSILKASAEYKAGDQVVLKTKQFGTNNKKKNEGVCVNAMEISTRLNECPAYIHL